VSTTVPEADHEPLAAIDIGTNSVHMVVARAVAAERFEIIAKQKDMVRLGSGGGEMKELAADAIDRGVEVLSRCRAIAEAHGASVRAVATSAVREAANQGEFILRAREDAGVVVEVISGFEEARLIYLGVIQALPVFDERALVMDIGGGSTELVVGERGDVRFARSLKLGAIRLTERFFAGRRLKGRQVEECRQFVRASIAPALDAIARYGFDSAVASSGTLENLAVMAVRARGGDEPRTLNGARVTRDELDTVVDRLLSADRVEDRLAIDGLEERRADIIVGGALIAEQIVAAMGIDEFVVSEDALREGVLLDTFRRQHGASLHHLRDLRRRSVLRLAELTDEDPAHSAKVAELALTLFDQLVDHHGLDDRHREYLQAAALLCNVGLFISHSAHHKHSYYVIRHAEHLTGFTDDEIELIAQTARYHRRSAPKKKHETFAALDPDGRRVVRTLAGVLRVAIGLDRTHSGLVDRVSLAELEESEDRLVIEVSGGRAELETEIYSANERSGLLEDVLGRDVVIAPVAV
jgi:exopolyphosphatase/guanosine-5'-triphosphate,3'-diphosphate pyrophosphatase